jgi:hypothetical protein
MEEEAIPPCAACGKPLALENDPLQFYGWWPDAAAGGRGRRLALCSFDCMADWTAEKARRSD